MPGRNCQGSPLTAGGTATAAPGPHLRGTSGLPHGRGRLGPDTGPTPQHFFLLGLEVYANPSTGATDMTSAREPLKPSTERNGNFSWLRN
jgi:hypothetical protein